NAMTQRANQPGRSTSYPGAVERMGPRRISCWPPVPGSNARPQCFGRQFGRRALVKPFHQADPEDGEAALRLKVNRPTSSTEQSRSYPKTGVFITRGTNRGLAQAPLVLVTTDGAPRQHLNLHAAVPYSARQLKTGSPRRRSRRANSVWIA